MLTALAALSVTTAAHAAVTVSNPDYYTVDVPSVADGGDSIYDGGNGNLIPIDGSLEVA